MSNESAHPNYRLPWRLEVDADVDDAFEPGVRYCRVVGPGRFDSIAAAWDHPHIYRLIAAAPELLEALESVLAFEDPDSIEDQRNDARLRQSRAEAWEKAKAAIRKATGGAQ